MAGHFRLLLQSPDLLKKSFTDDKGYKVFKIYSLMVGFSSLSVNLTCQLNVTSKLLNFCPLLPLHHEL